MDEKKEAEFLAEVARRLGLAAPASASPPLPAGPTFAELWVRYYREEARFLDSARDIARMGRGLTDRWGARAAISITTTDAEDYRDARNQATTRRGGPPRPGTINRELACARRCLQWGLEQRILAYNPLAGVTMAPEDNIRHSKIHSEEELQQLLALADRTMKALILIQIDCGFRRGEAFTLQWSQVAIVMHKGQRRPIVQLWETKNGKPRRCGLSWRTFEAIWALPRHGKYIFVGREPGRYRADGQEAPPRPGTHLSEAATLRKFQRLAARTGLKAADGENFTFHMLRHSFAYLARRRDHLSERQIMLQGGWKTRSAFDRYGIGDEEELADMYEIVDANIQRELDRIKGG